MPEIYNVGPLTKSPLNMSQFPVEIWEEIFKYLGSSFFCEDRNRLTICKRWCHNYALPTMYGDITLNIDKLRKLLRPEHAVWKELRLCRLRSSLKHFTLAMDPYEQETPELRTYILELHKSLGCRHQNGKSCGIHYSGRPPSRSSDSSIGLGSPCAWEIRLCLSMYQRLTDLTIDFSHFENTTTRVTQHLHVFYECPFCNISKYLFGTLRTLRLRVPQLCPKAFQPYKLRPEGFNAEAGEEGKKNMEEEPVDPIPLETLLVNLSVYYEDRLQLPTPCNPKYEPVAESVGNAVQALIPRMKSAKKVRAVAYNAEHGCFDRFDALTGQAVCVGTEDPGLSF